MYHIRTRNRIRGNRSVYNLIRDSLSALPTTDSELALIAAAAIINPSHKLATGYAKEVVADDGTSKMYVYNEYMTVQELIDIVMFLQPYYDVVVPEFRYPVYP